MDNDHTIYLCQVNETVSCGACCGLYNLPDVSRNKLETILSSRTKAFASVPRTEDGIFEFHRRHKGPHRLTRPFPGFHHCPFLGLIGTENSRVGCLLHPTADGNGGADYRSLSWYGEQACRTYFCPATHNLPANYQSILVKTIENWYIFGLIVTEYALLNAYFKEVEIRLGRPVSVRDFTENTGAKDALREFAELKNSWPYRRSECPGPCNFFFENGLYPRPDVKRTDPGIHSSSYEKLFRELDSGFSSTKEITAAEHLLDKLFSKTVDAIV